MYLKMCLSTSLRPQNGDFEKDQIALNMINIIETIKLVMIKLLNF